MSRIGLCAFLIHDLNFARLFARLTPVFLLKRRPSFARLFTKMSPSEELVTLHSLWLTFQVRLSFLTAPSFALLDHPLPLVLRLENNCERTVGVPVLEASSIYSAGEVSNHQFYAGWARPFPLFTHLWPANLVLTKLFLNWVQMCC